MESKGKMRRFGLLIVLPVIAVLLVLGAVRSINAPPGLSAEQLNAYSQVVDFAARHQEWGNFSLYEDGQLYFQDPRMSVNENLGVECCSAETRRKLGDKTIEEAKRLVALLQQTSTLEVYRSGDMLFFYSAPSYGRLLTFKTPGYVYSMHGADPNQRSDHHLDIAKPFYPIRDRWYYSRNMFAKSSSGDG